MKSQQMNCSNTKKLIPSSINPIFTLVLLKYVIIGCLCVINIQCENANRENLESKPIAANLTTLVIEKSKLELRPMEGLVYYQKKTFTGISVQYYAPEQIAVSIPYFNGKKEGLYQKWFPNGQISFEANYVKGRQEGLTKSWWAHGVQRSESTFKNGVSHGVQLQWYKSGAKFKRMNVVEGKEEGLQQAWRENGKIYNNYEAKNGRIFGLKRANLCYQLADEIVTFAD